MHNRNYCAVQFCRRLITFAVCTASLPLIVHGETLCDVLNKEKLSPTPAQIANLDQPLAINSYAMLNTPQMACIGYFLEADLDQSKQPLPFYLALLDKATQRWQTNVIADYEWGIPEEFFVTAEFLYLTTHLNPSAGYVGVIRRADLTIHDTLEAALMRILTDDTVLYLGDTPHFAPVHPVDAWLYTPASKVRRQIYPLKPYQSVRLQHIARLQAEFERRGQAWFTEHNYPDNPEYFSEDIAWEQLAFNAQTDALAFVASYDNTEAWNLNAEEHPQEPVTTDVVCVFWHVRSPENMRYAEILLEDVLQRYGGEPLTALLTPQRLTEIFQQP